MLRLEGEDVDAAKSLLPLLDGSLGAEEIATHLPEYDADSVIELLANLEQQGFVERVGEGDSLWRAQERFLAAWSGQGNDQMEVLRRARVVVVGLEPWGVVLASELAASAVGHLHLFDDGLVGEDDLLGSRVFSSGDCGRPRVEALADVLSHRAASTELVTGPFEELNLPGDECSLVIGALAPDELKAWLTLARICHEAGARSLSGYLQGREAIVGPLVIPGQTACWNCFRLRQAANVSQPEDERNFQEAVLQNPAPLRPRAYLASMPPLVGQLVALEAVKFLVAGASPLVGRVLIHDLIDPESALHTVVRVPWCEICGQAQVWSRAGSPSAPPAGDPSITGAQRPVETRQERKAPNLDRVTEPGELRDLLHGCVDSRVGIVNRLAVPRPKVNEPQLPFFSYAILSTYSQTRHREWQPELGFGKGLTRVDAALSAVGEAIERYSACQWPETVCRAALDELDGDVLDPRDLTLYSDEQYADPDFPYARFDPGRPIDWVRGRWLDDGAPVWVPALVAYLHYPAPAAETFCAVTTSGLAAGASIDDAASRAALELLERDSFTLTWLSMSPPRPLAVRESLEGVAAEALRQLERHAGPLEFYLLDVAAPISVVACVSSGDGEHWPGVVVGMGSHLSPVAAVRKAMLEQAQAGLSLRRAMRAGNVEIPGSPEEVRSEIDHMTYYVPSERAESLDFWRKTARQPVELCSLPEPPIASLSGLNALSERSELRLAVVDVTAPDVAESPFRVARAVGAGIQQISFGFRQEPLGNRRLQALAAGQLNPDPHPVG